MCISQLVWLFFCCLNSNQLQKYKYTCIIFSTQICFIYEWLIRFSQFICKSCSILSIASHSTFYQLATFRAPHFTILKYSNPIHNWTFIRHIVSHQNVKTISTISRSMLNWSFGRNLIDFLCFSCNSFFVCHKSGFRLC